ncbi:MAG: hypothetical protein IJI25_09270 [Eubacterium sp.]|nr:hypothetical protein [Eubacterium sp.]
MFLYMESGGLLSKREPAGYGTRQVAFAASAVYKARDVIVDVNALSHKKRTFINLYAENFNNLMFYA